MYVRVAPAADVADGALQLPPGLGGFRIARFLAQGRMQRRFRFGALTMNENKRFREQVKALVHPRLHRFVVEPGMEPECARNVAAM